MDSLICLIILLRVTSRGLGKSHDCPSASLKIILKNMGLWFLLYGWYYLNKLYIKWFTLYSWYMLGVFRISLLHWLCNVIVMQWSKWLLSDIGTVYIYRLYYVLLVRNNINIFGCDSITGLNLRTNCHAQDLWKFYQSCKQMHLLCPPDPWNLLPYSADFKFPGSFEIHWVRQYAVNVVLFGNKDL